VNLFRKGRDPLVDLSHRLRQLLLASGVRGRLELALCFGSRQSQRFNLPRAFRVQALDTLTGLASFLFAFFHPLGEAGLRVDEAFSSVTHIF